MRVTYSFGIKKHSDDDPFLFKGYVDFTPDSDFAKNSHEVVNNFASVIASESFRTYASLTKLHNAD